MKTSAAGLEGQAAIWAPRDEFAAKTGVASLSSIGAVRMCTWASGCSGKATCLCAALASLRGSVSSAGLCFFPPASLVLSGR